MKERNLTANAVCPEGVEEKRNARRGHALHNSTVTDLTK